ncbi:MAG: enoyl-CoA hydratase [Nocardioidaceae bacterium]|nr:enoyl-CoA hydratase [Nocardioidaceae bacterium]
MIGSKTHGAVTVLELQRDERRNALNTAMCRALYAAVDEALDERARVLVITGQGSAFCAGADLDAAYDDDFLGALYGMLGHLREVPVPIVAAVNGPAIGAGTQLAMACDLRVADETATFAVPTARNGMAVDAWTIRTLSKLAGEGTAREMMLAATTLDRDTALAAGLVERRGGLDEAIAWATEISALAPLALAHNKLVLNSTPSDDDAIAESFAKVWASNDVREAAAARSEKRPPVFRGE